MSTHIIPRLPQAVSARLIICVFLLLLGILGMTVLASLKEAPPEDTYREPSLRVHAITVTAEDIQVSITGYGEIQALDYVSIAPEISGKISAVHPRLEAGEVIGKDDMLFEIDSRNYEAAWRQARARVEQCANAISQLQIQNSFDLERLKTLERTRDLAGAQLDRMRTLCETHGIVAQSRVESAEQAYNSVADVYEQLARAVDLYPIQIKDANDGAASAKAELQVAEANLSRCMVRAPFEGRIKEVSVEVGQYVVPGQPVMTLANDAILEIHVPIDSRDAQQWLRFDGNGTGKRTAWFDALEDVPCRIRWTEDHSGEYWEGRLHRVVKFDKQTRMLVVAVRIDSRNVSSSGSGQLPLAEGMFCTVEIPGKTVADVFQLPREAVSFENTVYVSENRRLKTVPVRVVRIEGDRAFVSAGLKTGDLVITTRLVDPLENCLLEIRQANGGEGK